MNYSIGMASLLNCNAYANDPEDIVTDIDW